MKARVLLRVVDTVATAAPSTNTLMSITCPLPLDHQSPKERLLGNDQRGPRNSLIESLTVVEILQSDGLLRLGKSNHLTVTGLRFPLGV
jgi:hypothetical protein